MLGSTIARRSSTDDLAALARFAALVVTGVLVAFGLVELGIAYASTVGHPHALGMESSRD